MASTVEFLDEGSFLSANRQTTHLLGCSVDQTICPDGSRFCMVKIPGACFITRWWSAIRCWSVLHEKQDNAYESATWLERYSCRFIRNGRWVLTARYQSSSSDSIFKSETRHPYLFVSRSDGYRAKYRFTTRAVHRSIPKGNIISTFIRS